MKILQMEFQRNGVHGNSFYHAIFKDKNSDKNGLFLATFETDAECTAINISSCRVVDINNISESWRGDEFAWELDRLFRQSDAPSIYDWMLSFKKELINL